MTLNSGVSQIILIARAELVTRVALLALNRSVKTETQYDNIGLLRNRESLAVAVVFIGKRARSVLP
jgi:hypothetical protein